MLTDLPGFGCCVYLCRGVTAMSAMIVLQLGFAMIAPPPPISTCFMASGFTSGITRGTPSVMRNALELSTTWTNGWQPYQ